MTLRASPSVLSLAVPALVVLAAEPLYLLVDTAVVGHLGAVALGGLAVGGGLLAWSAALLNFLAYGTTARAARRAGAGDRAGAVAEGVQATWLALGLGLVVLVFFQLLAGPLTRLLAGGAGCRRRGRGGLAADRLPGRAAAAGLAGGQRLAARGAGAAPSGALRAGRQPGQRRAVPAAGATRSGWASPARPSPTSRGRRSRPACSSGRCSARTSPGARGRPPSGTSWSSAATCSCGPRCSSCRSWSRPGVAARAGTAQLGAHQIALQLFFFLALVLDAYAIAAQTLVGQALGANRPEDARATARRVALWGLGTGLVVAAVLLAFRDVLLPLFTDDAAVLEQAEVVWWFLAAMQPLAGVVFALDGVLMGAGDVAYLRTVTIGSALVGFLPLSLLALPLSWGLAGIWTGLCLFIGLRLVAVLVRVAGDRWLSAPVTVTRVSPEEAGRRRPPGSAAGRQARRHDVARRRRPGPARAVGPQGRARRDARPDGHRTADPRRRCRHPAARLRRRARQDLRGDDPARPVHGHRRPGGRGADDGVDGRPGRRRDPDGARRADRPAAAGALVGERGQGRRPALLRPRAGRRGGRARAAVGHRPPASRCTGSSGRPPTWSTWTSP